MKANEIIVQNSIILMEKMQEKQCWRIKKAYVFSFIAHLQHYFIAKMCPLAMEDTFYNLCYIDINEEDFCLISFLFAAFEVSGDRIKVRGVFPENHYPLWKDHITLYLCMKENGRESFMPLRLEMKKREMKRKKKL